MTKPEIVKLVQQKKCKEAHLIDAIADIELELASMKKELADTQYEINQLEKFK